MGLDGFTAGTGRVHTDLSTSRWDGLADRIAHVRRHAGERFAEIELSVLVQAGRDDRRPAGGWPASSSPGDDRRRGDTARQPVPAARHRRRAHGQIARLRDEMGVTYVTTFEPGAEALAAAAAPLR